MADRPQSLAEFLGVADPLRPEAPVTPPPSPKLTVKAFCREILNSPQYRESILRRIIMDELPESIERMLWDRAHGKVVDRVEFKDMTDDVDEFNAEQCEQEALRLLEVARQIRLETSSLETQTSEGSGTQVH